MDGSKFDLLLKEILECLTGIAGARNVLGGRRWSRSGSRRSSIFFNRGAKFVEPAIVALILAGDAFRNWLHAFKPRGRIKISALLAGVQLESALRALAFRIESRLQNGATIGTSCASDRAHHARCPRSDLFLTGMAFGRPFLFFLGLLGTHVATLLILPLQGNLRGVNYIIRYIGWYNTKNSQTSELVRLVKCVLSGLAGPESSQAFRGEIGLQKLPRRTHVGEDRFGGKITAAYRSLHCRRPARESPVPREN